MTRSVAPIILFVSVCAGCVGTPVTWHDAPREPSTAPDCAWAPRIESNFDRPALEIVPLLDEEEKPADASSPSVDAIDVKPWWGVRFGSLNTVGGSYDWTTTGFLGVFRRDPRPFSRSFAYELALDVARVPGDSEDNASVSSSVSVLRIDTLYGQWAKGGGGAAIYALVGIGVGSERSTWELTGITREVNAPVIDIGFGMTGVEASWDARFGYTMYGGTGARGGVTVGLGLGF